MNTHPLLLAGLVVASLTACDPEHRPPIIPEPAQPYRTAELPLSYLVEGIMESMPAQELSLFDTEDEALTAALDDRFLSISHYFQQPEEPQQVALLSTVGAPDTILLAASEQQPGELRVISAGHCGLASLPLAVQMHQAWLLDQAQTSVELSYQQDCYQEVEPQQIDLPRPGAFSGLTLFQPQVFTNQAELDAFFTEHELTIQQPDLQPVDFTQYQLMFLPYSFLGHGVDNLELYQRDLQASNITQIELQLTQFLLTGPGDDPCSIPTIHPFLGGYWLLVDKDQEIQYRLTEKIDWCRDGSFPPIITP